MAFFGSCVLIQRQSSTLARSISMPISTRTFKSKVSSLFSKIFRKTSNIQALTSGLQVISPVLLFQTSHHTTKTSVNRARDTPFAYFFIYTIFIVETMRIAMKQLNKTSIYSSIQLSKVK